MSNSLHRAESTGEPSRSHFGRGVGLKAWLRALEKTSSISTSSPVTLASLVDDLAVKFSEAFALIGEEECLSYRTLAERCNRYARWALDQGLGGGGVVGLVMPNCPDYMAIWLGITRVGGVVALIN